MYHRKFKINYCHLENILQEAKNNQQSGKSQTIVVGTWGAKKTSPNGVAFDDGAYTGIREIYFEYNNKTAIGGIQVTYDLNGKPLKAEKHRSFIKGFTPVKVSFSFNSSSYKISLRYYSICLCESIL